MAEIKKKPYYKPSDKFNELYAQKQRQIEELSRLCNELKKKEQQEAEEQLMQADIVRIQEENDEMEEIINQMRR